MASKLWLIPVKHVIGSGARPYTGTVANAVNIWMKLTATKPQQSENSVYFYGQCAFAERESVSRYALLWTSEVLNVISLRASKVWFEASRQSLYIYIYIAGQLIGITLLVRPFCLTAGLSDELWCHVLVCTAPNMFSSSWISLTTSR